MVIRHFLNWLGTARVSERAAAAGALAAAYVAGQLDFEDRCAAEAALTLLLDDPSQRVRYELAEALSMCRNAPPQIIQALADDQAEIAALVLARSPLFSDADLIDRVAASPARLQAVIASRPGLAMGVAAAVAEVGAAEACLALLDNAGAGIATLSFRRMAERHGAVAAVREALMRDPRLPSDCRHMLLLQVGEALRHAPLVTALIGTARAERVTREACVKASLSLISGTPPEEHAALVEHLRLRGELTVGFLVRMAARGEIDFLGAVLVALTGREEGRVTALLAGGRDPALRALLREAALPAAAGSAVIEALRIWRDVANGRRVAGVQEVSWRMLEALGSGPESAELSGLLKAVHLEALRENARGHALAIAAA